MAKSFEQFHNRDLFGFIDHLEILDELGGNPVLASIREDDAVNLMTIHGAKVLEFNVVFVIHMARDKFPPSLKGVKKPLIPLEMLDQYRDLFLKNLSKTKLKKELEDCRKEIKTEEERRLCYVAFTRAKEDLILTLFLEYSGKKHEPSEFLTEIGYNH